MGYQDQKYWAKYNDDTGNYHLVRYHCVDVAAMFETILEQHDRTRELILRPFKPEDHDDVLRFLTFLAALHDVGKFGAFQAMKPEFCESHGINFDREETYHHSTSGWIYWDHFMTQYFDYDSITEDILTYYEQHIFGHHGYPPGASWKDKQGVRTDLSAELSNYKHQDVDGFIKECYALYGEPEFPHYSRIDLDQVKATQWVLNGMMVFSDWMGSTESNFPFKKEIVPLEDYYDTSMARAKDALDDLNFLPKEIQVGSTFDDLFPDYHPRPTQQLVEDFEFGGGAQLLIIEDATGSGKTEASILSARKIIDKGASEGIYFGLPTQVSAEAMLERVAEVCSKFFDKDDPVLGSFASGSAHISPFYSEIKKGVTDGIESHGWLNKKSALLSQMGAGTVDQALMSVIAQNHQGLRLYGLSRNVLIIDEVHAYQTYQITLLKSLLRQCRKLDIPVILLSATLPQKTRQELVRAYSGENGLVDRQKGYPLITYWKKEKPSNLVEEEVKATASRTYQVQTFQDDDMLESIVQSRPKECGAVFVNTVKRANKVYNRLCNMLGKSNVFLAHSRFAQHDRNRIESQALRLFGKDSVGSDRAGKVMVCTQVFQESINLDFDYGILDLAPIDALFQRMGRIWRYIRNQMGIVDDTLSVDARGTEIPVYVYGPEPVKDPTDKWYVEKLRSADFVYRDTSVLWNTMNVLERKQNWTVPEHAREILESVYGEHQIIWDSLEERTQEVLGRKYADQGAGHQNRVKFHKSFMDSNDQWVTDVKMPTRLSYPTKTVALGVVRDGEIVPLYDGYPELSQFSVPEGMAYAEMMVGRNKTLFEHALEDKSNRFVRDRDFITYIILEPTGKEGEWGGMVKTLSKGDVQPKKVKYSQELGYSTL